MRVGILNKETIWNILLLPIPFSSLCTMLSHAIKGLIIIDSKNGTCVLQHSIRGEFKLTQAKNHNARAKRWNHHCNIYYVGRLVPCR